MSSPVHLVTFLPLWDMPSPSPFCAKLETWLRMVDLAYETEAAGGPSRASNGKLPYIVRSDGSLLADSQVILQTLTEEHGIALDAHLDTTQRATSLLIRRLLEEHMYWVIVRERWLDDSNWAVVSRDYFRGLPAPLRAFVPALARRGVRRNAHGQGLSRYTPQAITRLISDDLDALEGVLGQNPFFLGEASSVDASGFAFLASAIAAPFDSELKSAVLGRATLLAYVERCRARWWPELPSFPR